MKKVVTVKHDKLWGYEIWLYSSVPGMETIFEDGMPVPHGPLLKIIKADQPLSLQVHPDDAFASELESQPNGKSESWYVLDHEKDAEIVTGLTSYDEKEIRTKLEDKTFYELLQRTKVKKAEFYNIPAGRVHGIGGGVTVFEAQQPSDVTYRYYDYDRLQDGEPRELHVDKAIKVQKEMTEELAPISTDPLTYDTDFCIQSFMKEKTILKDRSIIVDFKSQDTFLAEEGEEITFKHYAVISMLK